uniref:ZU5 domain-containing protein n=1 Tax=Amphimedon queenslandica TaxID=400682 RepID=A0A1X7T9G4_AMPQE
MRRSFGGMISFEHDGVHHLLMIGGHGSQPAVQLPHYKYIYLPGKWRTNEHSMYNISSREWSNPSIIGQCIPPASGFIIEKINNTRAVLFGGKETDDDESEDNFTNNIYILEISISTVTWQCIKKPEAIDQWPVGRCYHAGAIIITGSDCPMLVISGGKNTYMKNELLDDCWIFNIIQHSWIKLDIPRFVSQRYGHSLSAFIMSPHCVWIITVGGFDIRGIYYTLATKNDNIFTLTELVTNGKGEWLVTTTLDEITDEYYKKYQQQLRQLGRRIWLEEYQKSRKGSTADTEQTVEVLLKSLEEKERKLQEKEREAQVYHQQLEQKEKEKAKKEQEIRKYYHQLQEKEKEKAEQENKNLLEEMQRYTKLLQDYKQLIQEKAKEIQHYRHQLKEKEREKERKETQQDEAIQIYCQQLQAMDQEIQKYCEKLKEEAEKEKSHQEKEAVNEKEIQRYCQELREKEKKEAEKEHQLMEERRLKDKYFKQLQEKDKKLAEKEEKIQMCHYQLQEKEREEAQRKEYYNFEIKKKKELEKEIQRLNQLLQNKDQELIESDQKLKEHLQQIQQYEHLKVVSIQEEETRAGQEKVQEIKLLHSSEEDKELQDVKSAPKEDNSKGNEMHESTQGCNNDFGKILDETVVESTNLKGVHVAAKNSFVIHGESTQSINWEEYGIRITIPQGAVLPSNTVQVTITALVGGDFIFPEDTELVSAVYAISLSKPFIEPVKLEIQHCVSIETSSHCNYLSFSTSINNQPPYQFDTVDGGEFSIGNRYGGISIATFSKYCIKTYSGRRYQPYSIPGTSSSRARSHTLSSSLSSSFDGPCSTSSPVSSSSLHSSSSSLSFDPLNTLSTKNEVATLLTLADKPPIKCYHSQVIYEIKRQGREWLMKFFVSKYLNALIEYIKKAFRNVEKSIEVSFQFKDDDGFIKLCFDGQCPRGWSVRPHQDPTRVRQIVIDEYGSMSPPRFPECLITISATPGEGAVKELSYPVTLQGIKKSNFEKMNIVLTMGDMQLASAGTIASNTGSISLDDEERKSAGEVLRENFDTLSDILAAPNNLSAIIMSLYAKKLISDTTATECMNDGRPVHDRCASLLFALKATIDGKPQAMIILIE